MAKAENLSWRKEKLAKFLVVIGTGLEILKLKDSQPRCPMEDIFSYEAAREAGN